MVDTNVPHDIEDRLRNIEAHMGIGHVDEETGEYTVDQAGEEEKPEEPGDGRPHDEEEDEDAPS